MFWYHLTDDLMMPDQLFYEMSRFPFLRTQTLSSGVAFQHVAINRLRIIRNIFTHVLCGLHHQIYQTLF